jgi:hypothetical protein
LYASSRSSAGRGWLRGSAVIVVALAVSGLVAPARAEAHGRASVIALDYQARLSSGEAVAPGVRARVLDGNRKLELSVDRETTVVVRGYAGERFLRFTAEGVSVNVGSPTAIADKLTPGATPILDPAAPPRWKLLTPAHRLAWHDHRLGPRPTSGRSVGRVGSWAIPIVVDGAGKTLEGGLWRAAKPSLWPWALFWVLTLAAAVAAAARMKGSIRHRVVPVGSALCAGAVAIVAAGFTFSSARTGLTRWLDVVFPAQIALAAVAVFFLKARHRLAAAACVAGFAFASGLQDVPVFVHGFVVSSLPAEIVRAVVALALAAGGFVLVVALVELWRGTPNEWRRPSPRPRPQMAIPRGRAR